MKLNFKSSELTSEKSLWDVYLLTRRIKPSLLHVTILGLSAFALTLKVFIQIDHPNFLLEEVRNWASNGFNFSITTLGFLIAGFTIFVTVAKPDMMLAMMDHTDPETNLPTLKANLAKFMHVFIVYIACSALYLLIILFGQKGSIIAWTIQYSANPEILKSTLIAISYIYVGTSFAYLLLTLKSFIFNIYTIVMNFLRWEKDKPDTVKCKEKAKETAACETQEQSSTKCEVNRPEAS